MQNEDETSEKARALALIGVPSSAGARRTGQERAPAALRSAGLLEGLRSQGWDVADLGDGPTVSFRPDLDHPRKQNAAAVVDVARSAANRVAEARSLGRWPLVLGGDCSLSLGVIAELVRHHPRLGLLYFDGDVDLNTPETTRTGIFDGMVMAHILGRGDEELAGLGSRRPLLLEEDIVLFGYDADSGWIDPPELEALERTRLVQYPLARVRDGAVTAAREALLQLDRRSEAFLVHFDVDVTSLPAVDVLHPGGLDVAAAFDALGVFLASPKCAGLVVTELNADLDSDGSATERLVRGIVEALGAPTERAAA